MIVSGFLTTYITYRVLVGGEVGLILGRVFEGSESERVVCVRVYSTTESVRSVIKVRKRVARGV